MNEAILRVFRVLFVMVRFFNENKYFKATWQIGKVG